MWIWFIFLQNLDFPTVQRLPSLTIVAHVITNFLAFVLREIRTIGGVPDALNTILVSQGTGWTIYPRHITASLNFFSTIYVSPAIPHRIL